MAFKVWARFRNSPSAIPMLKWKPRQTSIDLYNERDQTRWYWRMVAHLSAFLIMIGFLIFPSAFAGNVGWTVQDNTAHIVALVFLAVGYTLSVALWFICSSWLFQLDVIFMPCLSTCIFGLFNTIYYLNIRKSSAHRWTSSSITAVAISVVSTLVYIILALLTFRKIHRVRARDAMHRHTADADSIHLDPEDQQQRQQLLRLLQKSDAGRHPSPAASESTFHIDLPDSLCRTGSHLSTLPHAHTERSRAAPGLPIINQGAPWPPEHTAMASSNPPPITSAHPDLPPHLDPSHAPVHDNGSALAVPNLPTTYKPHEKELEAFGHHLPERRRAGRVQYRMETEEECAQRQRSASRESRRVEIEMESRGKAAAGDGGGGGRRDLEGVEVVPRIVRVETDGWERR